MLVERQVSTTPPKWKSESIEHVSTNDTHLKNSVSRVLDLGPPPLQVSKELLA